MTKVHSQNENITSPLDLTNRQLNIAELNIRTRLLDFNSKNGHLLCKKQDLKKIIEIIKTLKPKKINIEVHTTLKGDSIQNKKISTLVAEKLKSLLEKNKIRESKIITLGFGGSKPYKKDCNEIDDEIYNKRIKIILFFDE